MARAIAKFDSTVSLVYMAASPGIQIAHDCGIKVVREAYISTAAMIVLGGSSPASIRKRCTPIPQRPRVNSQISPFADG